MSSINKFQFKSRTFNISFPKETKMLDYNAYLKSYDTAINLLGEKLPHIIKTIEIRHITKQNPNDATKFTVKHSETLNDQQINEMKSVSTFACNIIQESELEKNKWNYMILYNEDKWFEMCDYIPYERIYCNSSFNWKKI
jgi:hypothetical protein